MPQVNYTNKALHAPARVYVRMFVCAYSTQESGSAGESDNLTTFECQNSMGWVHANVSGVSGRACDRWMAFCIVSEVGIVSGSGMCLCVCVCVCARVCETARHFLLPAKPNGIKREIVHQFIIGRELIEGSTRNTFMRLTLIEWLSERGRERKREERTDDLLCGGHSCGCCCCCCCVSMETCCHLLLLPRINIKKATTAATSTATTITKGGVGLNQVVN